MLDDRERRLWQDIEKRLVADDPRFRRRIQRAGRPARPAALAVWGATFLLVTVILWSVIGGPAALIGAIVFLILLPVVLRRTRRREAGRRHGPKPK